jgi:hypothetical protein
MTLRILPGWNTGGIISTMSMGCSAGKDPLVTIYQICRAERPTTLLASRAAALGFQGRSWGGSAISLNR